MKNKFYLYILKLIKKDLIMNQDYKLAGYILDIEKNMKIGS